MAIVKNNTLTEGLSGMIGGKIVFRNLRGRTIVASRPSVTRTQSERQRENRLRFKRASAYAKAMMLDPEKKKYYWHKARKLELPNAYTAAITDYMRRPVIKQITIANRRGGGNPVMIDVSKKDFGISVVEVTIRNEAGVVLERGPAIRKEVFASWLYKPSLTLTEDLYVDVMVTDQPGNRAAVTWRQPIDSTVFSL